ncbi:uncharacterized protein PHACADRAFT_100794 [Phanerochaete carnosa HHB-10118-sp]|uniref:Uncharacterized protein n=1 Tax=Phanerochaete carnosa (strain HHB-10118-sp) TaxID=650164 RepID=K5W0B4_PHACS|nr:uncharacterized protein PHACADRAFT_100794 [Phanerochaete carnosa HHB-10118-sp]EKM52540.1 hypothetical protein PHACADRAFT_100794 [Phanerochaete carnosa HHB-10118-sp]
MDPSEASVSPSGRGRGRGRSRGGIGKYLRARGRGRGRGRPAEFAKRLLLGDEQEVELDEEEAKEYEKEMQRKFGRRHLSTNADRYVESEPELGSDGEPIVEPEVDLSAFLEKQRLSPQPSSAPPPEDNDDIDTSITQVASRSKASNIRKGKLQQIEWDNSLEELSREKAAADATRELKSRFKTQSANPSFRAPVKPIKGTLKAEKSFIEAPALPTDELAKPKSEKEGMEDFLDDLLG